MMVSFPFTRRVFLYAVAAIPVSVLGVAFIWDGSLARVDGAVMVALYVAYVGMIWAVERQPPALGEVGELAEAEEELAEQTATAKQGRVGMELAIVVAGLAAMALGSVMLVEAVRQITNVEDTQTRLGLTLVGFTTSFELVMLVWSAARRGATDVALAGGVGSFGYNMTMSLGAGALVRPLAIADATTLRLPALMMLASLGVVLAIIALRTRLLERTAGIAALGAYVAIADGRGHRLRPRDAGATRIGASSARTIAREQCATSARAERWMGISVGWRRKACGVPRNAGGRPPRGVAHPLDHGQLFVAVV